jgi:hypothetical protein
MKELVLPWNNWQSGQSPNAYMTRVPPATAWPVTSDPHFSNLTDAYALESAIETAIKTHAVRKFDKLVRSDGQGDFNVQSAKTVLRPLFETTEVNLTSARQLSQLHPISPDAQTGPSQPIQPPDSFFLMSEMLKNLGAPDAAGFGSVAIVQPNEYRDLVRNAGLKITRNNGASSPGDANFAWLTPEPGFAMTNWINMLLQRDILSPQFVAAALAVDLETPIFSEPRKMLLDFIPDSFTVKPGEPHPNGLTRDVVQRLQAANAPTGSPARDFLDLLTQSNPLDAVNARVKAYRTGIGQRLMDTGTRNAELKRLFDLLIQRRQAFLTHPLFKCLKEFDALIPLPAPIDVDCR